LQQPSFETGSVPTPSFSLKPAGSDPSSFLGFKKWRGFERLRFTGCGKNADGERIGKGHDLGRADMLLKLGPASSA
jgi:hypothetical protein